MNPSMKFNFWNCGECQPNSEWVFKDVDGKMKGLSNTGTMFNATMRNAPATLAWQSKQELSQFDNLKFNLSFKVLKDSTVGSVHMTVKTKDALNFIGLAINFSEEKSKQEY